MQVHLSRSVSALLFTVGMMFCAEVARSQMPGDSVRVRLGQDMTWLQGRILDLDQSAFRLSRFTDTLCVPLLDVRSLDVARRRDKAMELLTATAVMSAVFSLTYLITPAPADCIGQICVKRDKPLSYGAMAAIGAGTGLVVGGIMLSALPAFRWQVVIRR